MYYEQFISGYNPKILSLVNNIKNGILIATAISYIFISSLISIVFIVLYFMVSISTFNIYVEYEYAITDNELDIFKISNKKRRKLVKSIQINKADRPISSNEFNQNRYKGAKISKVYTRKYEKCDKQIIILKEDGVTNVYELVLNEELLGFMSRVSRV
ncbi:hypothetical protein [Clostridium gasigenes]|uniref:hypothetical protein n=1 Tax=Clostridium gasigenes TaxID=94869 RepID=UPI001C0BCB99|nr:hypothetical protein [Clostridium gasigenes]MBU3107780.1 hypothetical protein [Clostridium gasigenes]